MIALDSKKDTYLNDAHIINLDQLSIEWTEVCDHCWCGDRILLATSVSLNGCKERCEKNNDCKAVEYQTGLFALDGRCNICNNQDEIKHYPAYLIGYHGSEVSVHKVHKQGIH